MIERKRLVPTKMLFPFIEAPALTALTVLIGYAVWGGAGVVFISIPGLLASLWLGASLKFYLVVDNMRLEADRQIRAAMGGPPLHIDATAFKLPGRSRAGASGIAWDGERLYMMEAGVLGVIPWADVRSWTWRIPGYAKAIVYGGALNPAAAEVWTQNASAEFEAAENSGFFVKVADVEKPTWHFQCSDQKVLERWFEIFSQIDEGRLRKSSAA